MATKSKNLFFKGFLFLWLFVVNSISAHADRLIVTLPALNTRNQQHIHNYFQKLIFLALQKTQESDGEFVIRNYEYFVSTERERALVANQASIDVIWGTVTEDRSKGMRMIPVDLVKGLNNYRFLFIREDKQKTFLNTHDINDLRLLTAGSGIKWSINEALMRNQIRVNTSSSFSGLFKMLAAERFDFIVRTPYEIIQESTEFGSLGIIMAPNIVLTFKEPQAYSFFVNKSNALLADRIERGLKLAQADGSFDLLFNSFPSLTRGQQLMSNGSYQAIVLE